MEENRSLDFTNIVLREALYWLRLSALCKYTALEALAVAR